MTTEATRRLVKSPPELWAEVSDPEALGRRLSEFGEIKITRVEREKIVAWEGEHADGTIEIGSSGWGTTVRITAKPVAAEAPPAPLEPPGLEPAPAPEPPAPVAETPAPPAPGPDPSPTPPAPPAPGPDPTPTPPAPSPEPPPSGPEPGPPAPPAPGPQIEADPPAADAPARRRGFFARLFGRAPEPALSPAVEFPPEPDPAPLPEPDTVPEPDPDFDPAPAAEAATDPAPAAEAAPPEPGDRALTPDDVRAVLERALDDLGAAHHRPFSRG